MYALYAVTTKANRSSARLLKNNRKTFSFRGKRFFSAWKRRKTIEDRREFPVPLSQNGSSFLRKEAKYCREAAITALGATGAVKPSPSA